jgi:hypothetical protein
MIAARQDAARREEIEQQKAVAKLMLQADG